MMHFANLERAAGAAGDLVDWTRPWGLFSDVHGNPVGLAACIERLRQMDARTLFFLGDAVGYLPFERAVLDGLHAAGAICISGNHDAMLLGRQPLDPKREAVYRIEAARERLCAADLALVASWPEQLTLCNPDTGATALLVHGGPQDCWNQYLYPDCDLTGLESYGHNAIIVGQTHRPFIRWAGTTLVVNVGSCGLPRDVGNLACCVLYDPTKNSAQIVRVPFDGETLIAAAEQIAPVAGSVKDCLRRRKEDANDLRGYA